MAQGTFGFILITAPDIVKVCGRQQYIHVNPFDGSDVFTQPVNPEGVIPSVATPTILQVLVGYLFYGVEHGVLIPEPLNSGETDKKNRLWTYSSRIHTLNPFALAIDKFKL
jgi:hypothetical protein